ncbi:MAG: DMT family transporter [candidate division WOR-3 bacterium]|nr:DMT family transporter [candidate division WOR-3 bacterium]
MYIVYLIFTVLVFSTMEVAGRYISGSIPPMLMTFCRFSLASLFLLPFFISRKENMIKLRETSVRELAVISLIGILNVVLSMGLLQIAVHRGNASIPAIMISSNPLFIYIILFAWGLERDKFVLMRIIAGIIGISGIILFNDHSSLDNPLPALIFSIGASMIFAVYTILARKYVMKYGNLFVTTISFIAGSLIYIPLILIFEGFTTALFTHPNPLILLYMGIVVTGAGYLSYFKGLKSVKASRGSIVFFLKPAFALIFSIILLGESINYIQAVFLILIILSLFPRIRRRHSAVRYADSKN